MKEFSLMQLCTILMMRIRCFTFLFLMIAFSAEMTLAQENTTESNVTGDSPAIFASTSIPTDSPSMAPSIPEFEPPTSSIAPTIDFDEICPNTLDWKRPGRPWEGIAEWRKEFSCDDDRVNCWDFGSLGPAFLHCCKCRPMCCERCNVPCTERTKPPITLSPVTSPSGAPGYNYDYKTSDSDSSSGWNLRPGPRHGALLIVVFFVAVIWCCNREQRQLRRTRRTMNQRRRLQLQNSGSSEDADEISEERYQLFLSKFHFETVPPHRSSKVEDNINCMVRENSTTSSKLSSIADEEEESEDSNGEAEQPKLEDAETADLENTLKSINSSATNCSYQPFASLKRIQQAKGECSICLDGYHPGDTVCIAVNAACNHVYHQECVVEWLKTNGRCPLCRVDLMK
ncbi:MAG: hypothetical protein SGBAC_012254 [Bacillariaceae sp.]